MKRIRLAVVAVATVLLAGTGVTGAHAADGDGNGTGVTPYNNGWEAVAQRVTLSGSGYTGGSGNVGSTPGISPPPCWFEPRFDSAGARQYLENDIIPVSGGSIGSDWARQVHQLLTEPGNGKLPYHEGEEGMWYGVSCGYDVDADTQRAFQLANPTFVWVGPGYPPPPGPTIDSEMLAEIARAFLTVPTVPLETSPNASADAPSFVNLPTWLWADPNEVFVTAAIPGLAATVTAELEDLRFTSVPAQATTHPGNGDCPGRGSPYRAGVDTPPCGVTFGAPAATATIAVDAIWHLTWTGTDGNGGDLGTSPFNQQLTFAVHEVQVVNGTVNRWGPTSARLN